MAHLDTSSLSPMALGRVNAALEKRARYNGEIRTLREHLATLKGVKVTGDGMIDWDRRKFNNMTGAEQRTYEERLKARRYFYVDGWQVPKIVWDCVAAPAEHHTYNRASYPRFIVNHGNWDICADASGHCAAIPTPEAAAKGCQASQFGDMAYVRATLAEILPPEFA